MRRRSFETLRPALAAILMVATLPCIAAAEPAVVQEKSAAEIMRSVFGNRVRDGGYWRQDNPDFKQDTKAPQYWMQVWRSGPGGEVVIVDAFEVRADSTCSALIHIVYTYDRKAGRIQSAAYGAHGLSGRGVLEFKGSTTSGEATILRPDGQEVRMRDREDHGAGDAVVVEAETWNGSAWAAGKPATWRRSSRGLPCDRAGATMSGH